MVVSRRSPLTSPPPEEKSRFAKKKSAPPKKTRLPLAGQDCVCRQVGELPFWEFDAPILWRRWPGTGFSGLFGFGPKMSGFVVQKRNETPETPETLETPDTLSVDVRIAFL